MPLLPLRLLVLSLLITPFLGNQTQAAPTRRATLSGDRLSVDSPCARQVEIRVDPGLHGQDVVEAAADHPEELDHLLLETRDGGWIHTVPAGCWQPESHGRFDPTLTRVIRVPAATPIAIEEAGVGDYRIGAVGGPLHLDGSGAVQLADAWATALTAQSSGQAAVAIARLDGVMRVDLSGNGHVTVDQAELTSLTVALAGSGNVTVTHGRIGRATLSGSGAGTFDIGAPVVDATVSLDGIGRVRFAAVTGTLHKAISGLGSVAVGE